MLSSHVPNVLDARGFVCLCTYDGLIRHGSDVVLEVLEKVETQTRLLHEDFREHLQRSSLWGPIAARQS